MTSATQADISAPKYVRTEVCRQDWSSLSSLTICVRDVERAAFDVVPHPQGSAFLSQRISLSFVHGDASAKLDSCVVAATIDRGNFTILNLSSVPNMGFGRDLEKGCRVLINVFAWAFFVLSPAVFAQEPATPTVEAALDNELPAWRKLETEAYRGKQDDIFFVNENVGWYVNGAGKIFKTVDGGAQWAEQLSQPGTYFRCIAFIDEKHGFAGNIGPDYFPKVTDRVPLYETKDGGVTWTPVSSIEGEPIVGLCALQVLREEFINAGQLDTHVRLIGVGRVGGPAAMIASDDLGATWKQVDISVHASMAFDAYFFNRREGFIAAASSADVAESNALILATTDGGATWTKAWQSNRPYELTWKMSFPSRDVGYVTIQSYNPDPEVADRFVAKTTDGGKSWQEIPLATDAKVREFGVAFMDENTGWVGAVPNGFETTDGGKTWNAVEMGNAVNKIRLLPTESGIVGYAIGVNVFRIDIPKPSR